MNCMTVRELLPALLYGDLSPEEESVVGRHLTECAACREEYASLQHLRPLLDAAPAPPAAVDLSRLYQEAARRKGKQVRRWRYAAAILAAAAALLVCAFALKLEVRVQGRELTLRWGPPPAVEAVSRQAAESQPATASIAAEDVQLLKDLVRAIAADVEARDQRQQESAAALRAWVETLQRQTEQHWVATRHDVAALYATITTDKRDRQ